MLGKQLTVPMKLGLLNLIVVFFFLSKHSSEYNLTIPGSYLCILLQTVHPSTNFLKLFLGTLGEGEHISYYEQLWCCLHLLV